MKTHLHTRFDHELLSVILAHLLQGFRHRHQIPAQVQTGSSADLLMIHLPYLNVSTDLSEISETLIKQALVKVPISWSFFPKIVRQVEQLSLTVESIVVVVKFDFGQFDGYYEAILQRKGELAYYLILGRTHCDLAENAVKCFLHRCLLQTMPDMWVVREDRDSKEFKGSYKIPDAGLRWRT